MSRGSKSVSRPAATSRRGNFLQAEAFTQQDKTLRKYLKPDLLIIDDMGLKALPKHSGEYLFEVIMRIRHGNRI